MLRAILPRAVLALVLLSAALFAFFESVYLHDQAVEFGEMKIVIWMWVFRGVTASLVLGALAAVLIRK